MANIKTREKARSLRSLGKSLSEIVDLTNASKSSVSFWCRDIVLTKSQIKSIQSKMIHEGRKAFIALGEKKRKDRIEREKISKNKGQKDVGNVSDRDLFFLGLGLYWGEGYKRGSGELGFTNSDSNMIQIFLKWLYEIYGVKPEDIILRLSINKIHEYRISKILKYWSVVTNLPLTQFTKTSVINSKTKKIYSDPENYFGVLRVKVRRGTELRNRILGSLEKLGARF